MPSLPTQGTRKANEEFVRAPCARWTPARLCSAVSTGPSTANPFPCSTLPQSGLQGTEITAGGPDTQRWYGEDLAYIHDVGHAEFALGAAPGIMEIQARNEMREGPLVDLGCCSDLWTH